MKNGLVRFARVAVCVAACYGSAQAAPTSPQVVAGQATFSQQGKVFSITNTPGAIINWQSFNVNAGEVTRFIQQSSDSAVLNRVTGQDPSRILGALQSNGKVFLINPNGIVFGQGARVDVNGLVASTLNIGDGDFLAGKKTFTAGATAGAVRNDGAITTPGGGKVFLVAPSVENNGIITAPNGEVVLAAGRSVKLVDSNNPDLDVVVSAPQDRAINLGQVVSSGGRIGIYGALVNQRGVVNANSAVVGENGKIVLKASGDTVLEAGSVTSATGAGKGGEIQLLGTRVGIGGNALVDASGAQGGGAVLAGGDYQGKQQDNRAALPNAQQTWFGKDARIRADALVSGEGGKVVLWSDGATGAYGSISARGAGRGNGGLIETSGHELSTGGIRIDAAGGRQGGKSGTWLLDPWNIVVRDGGETAPANADMFDKMPGDEDAVVDPVALRDTNANIVLQARNDLRFEDDLTTDHSVRAEAGNDLTVDARIRAGGDIDLRAGNRLTLGEGGELRSPNYIDLKAERMDLFGRIRSLDGVAPIVSLTTFNNSTPINVRGTEGPGALTLKPSQLADFEAFGINIGSSAHTGAISIDNSLSIAGHLSIDTGGTINVNAPVVLGDAGSRFTATLHPYLGGGAIQIDGAGSITAGKKIALSGGSVRVLGDLASDAIAIDAGSSGIDLQEGADLDAAGEITLRSNGTLYQNGASSIRAQRLLATGKQVQMLGVNRVGTLAGNASTGNFRFNWRDAMAIGSVADVSGVRANGEVDLTGGALTAGAGIEGVAVFIDADAIGGAGTIKGNFVDLASRGGIGAGDSPLRTSAGVLSAWNSQSGNAPINIVNDRAVILRDVVQAGAGNGGAISVESFGGLTVTATTGEGQGVKTSSGNISLVTHSPMTIAGNVSTESGNIRLLADNNGALTITSSARVASASGNISITGGSTSIAAGTVVVSSPDKLNVTDTNRPDPIPTPPLDSCISNPSTNGCGAVLEAKTRECIANMDGPQCGQVLPTTGVCERNPGTLGCTVVMERAALLACIQNPKGAGCGAILPPYDSCRNDQSRLGCAVVIEARAKLDACIQNPKGAGCGEILPTIEACKVDGNILGCAPVLLARQQLEACILNPKGAGCGEILPTIEACKLDGNILGCAPVLLARQQLEACLLNPKGAGCGEILPTIESCRLDGNILGCAPVLLTRQQLEACILNPKGAGCGEILPPLEQCRVNGSILGCAPVLARAAFDACLVNPTGAGCASVLPALAVCKATPGLEGCIQVLQLTFDACLATPGDASCVGILPTLSQCVNDKTAAGCQVVLPTLQQCIGSPTLQGCSVRLPRLEQCAVNPNTAGCEAVLPKPDFCSTHPGDASCQVFQPSPSTGNQGKKPVATAQQVAVNLINTRIPTTQQRAPEGPAQSGPGEGGDGRKASEKQAGPAQGPNTGAQNEKPAAKMYCN
ncbi:filamentous hemagglutinin N-terminal domain-containing protein [Massilia sp. BKSP1R2A-1]|uniref:two-partner secretion domain-containing protein n=1 Tax=Massilia sp. BKSP1R2A-1 TaxID=3422595 RepID=UPI003D356F3A